MADKTYVVTAPLVIAKLENGSDSYVYQNAPLPGGLADGEIDRLLDGEFIAEDKSGTFSEEDEKPAKKSAASK